MHCYFNCWPQGKPKCLTLSYDDATVEDRRLVSIMNKYGLRGSFHLNGEIWGGRRIDLSEVAGLYAGHEVSAHMANHPYPTLMGREGILDEILNDRRILERACGYPVRGMSYPFGDYDQRVRELLHACGMEYARTVASHREFHLPGNWMEWHPTCHHNDCLPLADQFLQPLPHWAEDRRLFYVWGHSYEFPAANNWNLIEEFAEKMGGRSDVWYATNIEIVDYINACRAVRSSADGTVLFNPSAVSVWFSVGKGSARELKSGETLKIM